MACVYIFESLYCKFRPVTMLRHFITLFADIKAKNQICEMLKILKSFGKNNLVLCLSSH